MESRMWQALAATATVAVAPVDAAVHATAVAGVDGARAAPGFEGVAAGAVTGSVRDIKPEPKLHLALKRPVVCFDDTTLACAAMGSMAHACPVPAVITV